MTNYEEARVKLTNNHLNKLKSAAKNKTGTALRKTKKNFQDEELPYELFLITRQKNNIRNAFANNVSLDIKFSWAQSTKTIQSGVFLGNMAGNFGTKSTSRRSCSFS